MSLTTTVPPQEYVRLKPAAMSKWPDSHLSIGARCYPLGRNQCWEVIGPARDISRAIFDATRILLNSRSDYVNEGEREQCMVIFGLYMIGKNKEKACPTLLFSCERKGPRQRAIKLAKGEDLLKAFPSVKLAESSRPPQSLEAPMLLWGDAKDNENDPIASWMEFSYTGILDSPEIYYLPSNSSCGALLARRYDPGSSAIRMATLGGIVCLRDEYFGLTAAHVFSGAYDPEYLTTKCDSEFAFDADSDAGSDGDEQDLVSMTSEGIEALPAQDIERCELTRGVIGSISSSSESSALTPKEHEGRPIGGDVSYFSDASLWQENASSSTDKWQSFGKLLSVAGNNGADWALIEIENRTFTARNLISWEENGQQRSLHPRNIAAETPSDHDVVLATGLNGVLKGKISGTPSYVLLPRGVEYQEVWSIQLDSVLAKGNSGTWVVDARNGDLLGHIIAVHPKSTIAYMLSAETIFSQLEKVFGGKFDLPTMESSIADSSTTPAAAIGVASTDPKANIDSLIQKEEMFHILCSINTNFMTLIDWTRVSTLSSEIVSLGDELKILWLVFEDLLVSTRKQSSEKVATIPPLRKTSLNNPDTTFFRRLDCWCLSHCISSLEPSKRSFMRDVLSVVQSSLGSMVEIMKNNSKEGSGKASMRELQFPESTANPSQDLKWIKAGINTLRQVLSPSLEFDRTAQMDINLAEGETSSRSEIISAINMVYNSLDSRKIKLALSPVQARLDEVAISTPDRNGRVTVTFTIGHVPLEVSAEIPLPFIRPPPDFEHDSNTTDQSEDSKLTRKRTVRGFRQTTVESSTSYSRKPQTVTGWPRLTQTIAKGNTSSRHRMQITTGPVASQPNSGSNLSIPVTERTLTKETQPSQSGVEMRTGLAVIAFSDQCLKYGNKFVNSCKNYLHNEEDETWLLAAIEMKWDKIENQIIILKRIAPGLDERLQDMQSQMLSQLEGKLKTATLTIEQSIRENEKTTGRIGAKVLGKAKRKSQIQLLWRTVEDIMTWQARYDPSWGLIMKQSIGKIDSERDGDQGKLKAERIPLILAAKRIRDAVKATASLETGDLRSVWLQPHDLSLDLDLLKIPYSSVEISALKDEGNAVLIDTVQDSYNDIGTTTRVRNLARVLAEVDPFTFGLLKCRGVIKLPSRPLFADLTDFKFIFDIPRGLSNPRSLRELLSTTASLPLDSRLELAKKLASSILFLHTVQFLHKSIRPETIIVFKNEYSGMVAPFLTGFEQFSSSDTYPIGDDNWKHNIYLHRAFQQPYLGPEYQMEHDIYSLGVVLLEIGIWRSFASYSVFGPVGLASGAKNKRDLETLAERELPSCMGRKYRDIVLLCLRCLDVESSAGPSFRVATDADGVEIGVSYIENVVERIHEISM